ncbi:MAG: type II toxin-antitoxin system HicA family toxin [Candidatus Levybacteria bacterium]|nr:type II toxin-antitoxin system HicA family toxin [Candidatus Levybacteria bacterium]
MPKVPQVSGKDTMKAFGKIGFVVTHQRGSHVKLSRTIGNQKQTNLLFNPYK